jgi:peptidoglycan/xylan/chitin deacetylase (PgdA/CDA1 family)
MSRRPGWAALRRGLRPVKRLALGPAARALELLLRCSDRRLGLVIVFHRVGDPAGDPALELVPALGTELFKSQLELLRRRYVLVPAAELLARTRDRRRFQRFPVSLTFDDDWSGHLTVTAPLLAGAGVRATFFLGGASLERPRLLWFELLQRAYDQGLMGPADQIHAEAARIQALPETQRQQMAKELAARLDEPAGQGEATATADRGTPRTSNRGLSRPDVRALAAAGHEIGFHTREHSTLTTLDDIQLEAALGVGRAELEAAGATRLSAIAYPAGQADARVVEKARAAGFTRGYSTMPHPVGPDSDPLWLGRVYPSHESSARFGWALARVLAARHLAGVRPPAV